MRHFEYPCTFLLNCIVAWKQNGFISVNDSLSVSVLINDRFIKSFDSSLSSEAPCQVWVSYYLNKEQLDLNKQTYSSVKAHFLLPVPAGDKPDPGCLASWLQAGRSHQRTGWQLCWWWRLHLGLWALRHGHCPAHPPSFPGCTWQPLPA